MMTLLTRKQVAEYLNVSVETVSQFVNSGELLCYSLTGKAWRFRPDDVEEFLSKRVYARSLPVAKFARKMIKSPQKGGVKSSERAGLLQEIKACR